MNRLASVCLIGLICIVVFNFASILEMKHELPALKLAQVSQDTSTRDSGVNNIGTFCFHRWMTTEEVIKSMDELNYRPGTEEELCGYRISENFKGDFPIIDLKNLAILTPQALNKFPNYKEGFYDLCKRSGYWSGKEWSPDCRFFAVCK